MATTMQEIMNPSAVQRDPDFPQAPADWHRAVAESVAQAEGLTLVSEHWELIRALQDFFAANPHPSARALHDALDERFHSRGGLKYLYELLPGGPIAQGCRLAGLPVPAGAIDRSYGSVQ